MMGTFSSSPAKNVPIGCLVCDLPGHEWAERAGNRGGPLGIQGVEDNLEGHRVIGDIRVGAEVQRADVLDDNVLGPGLIDEGAVPRKYSVVVPGGDDGVLNTGDGQSIRVEFLEECGAPQLLGQGSQVSKLCGSIEDSAEWISTIVDELLQAEEACSCVGRN